MLENGQNKYNKSIILSYTYFPGKLLPWRLFSHGCTSIFYRNSQISPGQTASPLCQPRIFTTQAILTLCAICSGSVPLQLHSPFISLLLMIEDDRDYSPTCTEIRKAIIRKTVPNELIQKN